jgi:hypothetical protein
VPDEAGSYELEVDVLHEHVRWFEHMAALPVQVDPDPDSLLVASPRLPGAMLEGNLLAETARLGEAMRASQARAERAGAGLRELRAGRGWRAAMLLLRPFDVARRRRRRR